MPLTPNPTIPTPWSTLSTPNPEFIELLKSFPPNFQLVTPGTTIASLRALGESSPLSPLNPLVSERDIQIPVRDDHQNRARVYAPAQVEGKEEERTKGPLLVMVHGGGFCIGVLEHVERQCREFVTEYAGKGGVVVSISHRRAPDARFPVPVEDCFDALVWIAQHADELGADPTKGFIMGDHREQQQPW